MYAVVKSGGKQYRVAVGDVIRVERLPIQPGESVELDQVLLIKQDNNLRVGTPLLSEPVTAKVRGHGRGSKIRIFKMRRRKNSRQRAGHRQDYTELEVTSIGGVAKSSDALKKPGTAKKQDQAATSSAAE